MNIELKPDAIPYSTQGQPLPGRLPSHPSHQVAYDQPLEFQFDGKT